MLGQRTQVSPVPPPLGALGTARWLWRQLTSMRTALLLLLLLAVATVPGSLFPQRGIDAAAVRTFLADNPGTGRWLDRLGFFDVYASPWFAATYLLLFVSLIGCVVPRTRAHLAEWRRRPPRTPRTLHRLPAHTEVATDLDADEALARARHALRRGASGAAVLGYVVDRHDSPAGPSLAAETGRLRESGNLLFHLSLIGVLVALAVSALYSYRGEALVVEGESFANVVPAYDSITPGARFDAANLPPFVVTLDSLEVTFEELQAGEIGAPRDFAATVTVQDGGTGAPAGDDASTRSEVVRVNSPLRVAGTELFLSGNGYAPVIEVRDAAGELVFSGAVPFLPQDARYTSTGVVKAPVADGDDIALSGELLPTAVQAPSGQLVSVFPDARDPRLALAVWTGDIGLGDGSAQSVYELDTSGMTQLTGPDGAPAVLLLTPGSTAQLPDGLGTVTFVDLPRFAAFQVRADPSGPLALGASSLALLGLTTSLFVPRRRLWVRAAPAGTPTGRTIVQVAGLSRSRDTGLQQEVDRVARAVITAAEGDVT